jgi:hypothetical protein
MSNILRFDLAPALRVMHPLLLFGFALLGNTTFQLLSADADWSPFSVYLVDVYCNIVWVYMAGFISICMGFIFIGKFMQNGTKQHVIINYLPKFGVLNPMLKISALLNIGTFILSQVYMGDAHMFNVLSGKVTMQQVEDALMESPLGIHSLSLICGYLVVLLWHTYRIIGVNSVWANAALFVALIKFVSAGKAQGLLYVLFAYALQQETLRKIWKPVVGGAGIIVVFLITRIIRNPDQEFIFGSEFIMLFLGGYYLGAPIVNTTYAFLNMDKFSHMGLMVTHLIPTKVLPWPTDVIGLYPDPTSPAGLIGTAIASSGIYFMIIYCFFVGVVSGVFFKLSKYKLTFRIHLPFMLMACAFSMMYNHFMTLSFFWIPLIFAFIIARYGFRKKLTKYSLGSMQ